jgi:hypothetical protein
LTVLSFGARDVSGAIRPTLYATSKVGPYGTGQVIVSADEVRGAADGRRTETSNGFGNGRKRTRALPGISSAGTGGAYGVDLRNWRKDATRLVSRKYVSC